MNESKDSVLEQLMASSMMVICQRCGASANYRGSPDKINAAAKELYELHERCYKHGKERK